MSEPDPTLFRDRQERRRNRLHERADRADREGAAATARAKTIADAIPFGQPILVGHHSEKRHRRDLDRIQRGFVKGAELSDKARRLRGRAESVGEHGIRAEEPDAPEQLRARIAELEADALLSKRVNAELRRMKVEHLKAKTPLPAGGSLEVHLGFIAALDAPERMKPDLAGSARAFPWLPQYNLALTRANIKRLQQRLASIEQLRASEEPAPVAGVGCTMEEDHARVRLVLVFPGKPAQEIRQACRRAGFVWSREHCCWQRQLTNNARAAGRRLLEEIARLSAPSSTGGAQ